MKVVRSCVRGWLGSPEKRVLPPPAAGGAAPGREQLDPRFLEEQLKGIAQEHIRLRRDQHLVALLQRQRLLGREPGAEVERIEQSRIVPPLNAKGSQRPPAPHPPP